jgi:nicotinamide riboside kinase
MLIGIIGSPCSGKTTVAAKLFAELKDLGLPTDYVAEQARLFIANKRFLQVKAGEGEGVALTDEDQLAIARQQFRHELIMSDPRTILITDSSVLNSLLYMSENFRQSEEVQSLAKAAAARYDLLFICHPVQRPDGIDPNRIHGEDFSLKVHDSIGPILQSFMFEASELDIKHLVGPSRVRLQGALSTTLEAWAELRTC